MLHMPLSRSARLQLQCTQADLCCLQAIEAQAARGIGEADVLILVMDGQAGFTSADQDIVSWLRKNHTSKPWLLCVNKCENAAKADMQARPSF